MNATFPKSERLCSKIGIEELFANGESRRSGGLTVRFLRVHVGAGISTPLNVRTLSEVETPKILISVPKRFQKRATDRNRTKRLIRDIYRKNKHLLARVCNPCQNVGTDEDVRASVSNIYALAIIYASNKIPDYAFVEEHLLKLLEKIT
ncbi:MAG: ribonuclease P protein component [Bacteroidales bacterium]|nr:ribonuclease P protein component [Bacteroidales bacterium]